MRIGIDVRPLSRSRSGIARYTEGLLKSLLQQVDADWFFYSDSLVSDKSKYPSVTFRDEELPKLFSPFRTQVTFSRWAIKDRLDVFWAPRHHLPLFLPSSIRQLVTVHDLVWQRFPETMNFSTLMMERMLMPKSIANADYVLVDCLAIKNELELRFPKAEQKIRVISPGISEFPEPKSVRLAVADYFLCVGTFEPRKNIRGMLDAFYEYRKRGGVHELIIVGLKGWGDRPLVDSRYSHVVTILGSVSDEDLGGYYRDATALLCLSYYEGFGLPVLEAMSFGTPTIGSKGGAIEEVIGKSGLVVGSDQIDEAATCLQQFDSQPDLGAKLGLIAIKRSEDFSWNDSASQLADLFGAQQYQ